MVGGDETADRFGIYAAITVGDSFHCQMQNPWHTGSRAIFQRWQFAAVTLGEMQTRCADLLFNQVEIVEQPFTGWRNLHTIGRHARELHAGVVEHFFILI